MGFRKLRRGSIKSASRAGAFFCSRFSCRSAASILSAFLLFLGGLMPSWHQASAVAAASSDFSQLQLLPGVHLDELEASICHHGDGKSSIPDHDQSRPCKNCPLCIAFHHLPPVPHRGFESAEYGPYGSTPFLLHSPDLKHVRKMVDQRRPRAPPLAGNTCAMKVMCAQGPAGVVCVSNAGPPSIRF
jgi:hypothetical protein